MEDAIRDTIEHQAKKLLERDKKDRYSAVKFERRYKLRTGEEPIAGKHRTPRHWTIGNHFDPRYCIRHSKFLAKVIWRKILFREYQVEPSVQYKIPKDGGGHREIMVFSIVDSAVANLFNRKLRDRNRNILSSFCYSYRKDRGLFDAVLQLCQRRSKNASAGRSKSASVMLARGPRTGGVFVSGQAWAGLSAGASGLARRELRLL